MGVAKEHEKSLLLRNPWLLTRKYQWDLPYLSPVVYVPHRPHVENYIYRCRGGRRSRRGRTSGRCEFYNTKVDSHLDTTANIYNEGPDICHLQNLGGAITSTIFPFHMRKLCKESCILLARKNHVTAYFHVRMHFTRGMFLHKESLAFFNHLHQST